MRTGMRGTPVAVVAATVVALTATTASPAQAQAPAPAVERVTLSAAGQQLSGASDGPRLSENGRYAAFSSYAADVVPGDTNGQPDVFVRDLRRGTVERITVAPDGTEADGAGQYVRISGDGRYVAFVSRATNLVTWPAPQSSYSDVYVHDRRTGTTERVSVAADGGSGGAAESVGVSDDGRYVGFTADAARIEGGGTPQQIRAYVHDRRTGETREVSDRLPGDWYVQSLLLSADGTHAAYIQRHPRGGRGELWLADLRTGEQRRLNVTPEGEPGDGSPAGLTLAADGGTVAYTSFDEAVVPGAPAYTWESYLYDARTGTTGWITHEGAGGLGAPLLSADGRRLAYTHGTRLPGGETAENVYVRELDSGHTVRATESVAGGPLTEGYTAASGFARDGRVLALFSSSSQLVDGDTNGEGDGFVARP
ncbi:TolB family protein [Streptomyces sp. NPDC056716]|uniref:TolB family protein n=1 Tax=unclassified Streptomyces TaxID=2593676 RepID=UPI0036946A01